MAMAAAAIWWHCSEGERVWEQCGDIKTLFSVLEIQIRDKRLSVSHSPYMMCELKFLDVLLEGHSSN